MNPKDIENLIKQRYGKMSEDDKEFIRDMFHSDKSGPVLRRFMGGSVADTFKLRKPKRMALGDMVGQQPTTIQTPGYVGGYNPQATPQQTIADDKPMDAENGDYIINAAAAEFAGKQDIQRMINGAVTNLQEKGVDLRFGNPKMNMRDNVKLLVSQNEVFIPKEIAKEIGYDRLGKINNRGKKRTQEVQEQTAQKENTPMGVTKAAKGLEVGKQAGVSEDILKFFGIGGQGDLPSEEFIPRDRRTDKTGKLKDAFEGFAKPPEPPQLPPDLAKTRADKRNFFDLVKGAVNMQEGGIKTKAYIPSKNGIPIAKSGVTIGRGVDLGQHTAKELKNIGFSDEMIQQFKPFIGKQGLEAKKAWEKSGKKLTLEPKDAEYISDMMLYHKMEQFDRRFTKLKGIANPRQKAVLVAEHFGGRLGLDIYKPFRAAMAKPNANLEQAYQTHVHNNPKFGEKADYMKNGANNLMLWFKETPGTTIKTVDPKEIKVKPIKPLLKEISVPEVKTKPPEIIQEKQIIPERRPVVPETRPLDTEDKYGNPRKSSSFMG
tara:strand:- start:67 stop:1698 length:1632 start_codon:yes stop_codon:yes gene_type:complete